MARRQKMADEAGTKVVKVVYNIVSQVEAVPHSDGVLKVRFNTSKPALCELSVGYNSLSPKYRKVGGYAHEMRHTLTARKLLPGQIYYIISGTLKDGSIFKDPVRVSNVPASSTVKSKSTSDVAEVVEVAARTDVTTSVGQEENVDSSADEEVVTDTVAVAVGESASFDGIGVDAEGKQVYIVPIDSADPKTRLENLAKGISTLARKHGPESLTDLKRDELDKHITWLKGEFDKYEDARGACELGAAYFEHKSYRKALRYATRGTKLDGNHIDSHKLRLKVFKKFGMGAKIQETQKKIWALSSPSQKRGLASTFDRNTEIYGSFVGIKDNKQVYADN